MGTRISDDILNAVLPLLKLLSISIIGLLISHPKIQLVPKSTYKLLSKLVFALFLPCLIFNHLGPSINLKNIILWWFIPLNIIISTIIGCILGYIVALITRPPPEFFRFTIIMTAFGNSGNIPLSIISSVCHSTSNHFGPHCYRDGVAYVSFSQWVCVILVYTLVYHMMEPPLEYYDVVEVDEPEGTTTTTTEILEEVVLSVDKSTPLLIDAEWPGMEDKETAHCKTPFIARLFNSISGGLSRSSIPIFEPMSLSDEEDNSISIPNSPKSLRCLAEPKVVRKIRIVVEHTPVQHILQPPMMASLLAIIMGVIPEVKDFVFGDDSPMEFLTDSLNIMAEAMVPSAMLILGGMLGEGPNESRLGFRTTCGIIVARLMVLPLIGIGVVNMADKWGFLIVGDELYKFVLLLQYTTPSAILLGAVASLRGYAVSEASALLFWQHVLAVISLAVYVFVYFKILFPYA